MSSFNWLTIERSRELAPGIPTGFLTIAPIAPAAALVYAQQHGHDYVLPNVAALVAAGEEFVRTAHSSGLRVGTWTVDDRALAARLLGWGVDAIATNDPQAMVEVRAGAGKT